MEKAYDPKQVEQRLYAWWDGRGYFKPESQIHLDPHEKPFTITIPPPNVTGTLHMGHALTLSIEDLMTRYYRMKGARTLWVPGSDHAGIATQTVVEKNLAKQGKSRHDMSRSDFVEEVWDWKAQSHEVITRQSKAMGISVDWTREAFTLDEDRSRAVLTAFKMLYDRGLIYRDTRMVNWDPVQQTGVSDLEAETDDEGEAGHLWTLRYPLQTIRWDAPRHEWGSGKWAEGATEWITLSTTRPETLLGDTAVMVNPDDERYTHLIGCRAILPVHGVPIPIISDASVDPKFGTGAVKVTPAHDFNDYEVGKRHHLSFIEVLDQHARMNDKAGIYEGLDRFECRKRIVEDLQKEGLLVKVEDYMVRLSRGQRSGAVLEPRMSLQWWCNMKGMADAAIASVREGRMKIVPERFEKVWFQWLENIRDWCISRQLWWGHQIPVWYVEGVRGSESGAASPQPTSYCALNETEAYAAARKDWGDGVKLAQDPDVLDTWFSSGLWPFSTLGWPQTDHPDFKKFYPTTMLETGYDILFFWVARMVMMGLELTGQEPFDTVYLHGLVRQDDGQKMSKSRPDKAIDPLKMVDQFGADALRFFLVTAGAPGNDIRMFVDRVEGARNFANKLWNATRFVLSKLDTDSQTDATLADRWIIARLNQVTAEVRRLNNEYQYGEAGKLIYEFIWSDFCDWYLELSKLHLNTRVLVRVLDAALRLLHPFMPFVTEELWQALKQKTNLAPEFPSLMLAAYPSVNEAEIDTAALADMATLQEVIRAIRNARSEYKVEPNKRVAATIIAGGRTDMLTQSREAIVSLANVDSAQLTIAAQQLDSLDQAATYALGDTTVYLPMSGLVDLAAERQRLSDELSGIEQAITRSESLLNSDFGKRAPASVIEKERAKLTDLHSKRTQINARLAQM